MTRGSVLLVEDEAIVAADLANKLGRLGYDVVGTAARGEDAIALAFARRPDMVLMDIHLQGRMDGVDAAARIRRECNVPVIYLTAHSDTTTLARAQATECYGYILKPFEERELETAIEMARYKHTAEQRCAKASSDTTRWPTPRSMVSLSMNAVVSLRSMTACSSCSASPARN
jgi:AmiR/NasT family two-component response regulator